MPFISYAQNFEDVILFRALGDVTSGFYVDVGANDPNIGSVTRAFYDRGWRGINIEPVPEWFAALESHRPRDVSLRVFASDAESEITLYDFPETGLATYDAAIARRHIDEGRACTELSVRARTLTSILEEVAAPVIHFLKIDVEGAEELVLRGLDLERFRPWVLVIEATLPNSPVVSSAAWTGRVQAARYRKVYFDGLNDYFVAEEHPELLDRLGTPPNVFDDFVLARQHELFVQVEALEANRKVLVHRLDEVNTVLTAHAEKLAREKLALEAEVVLLRDHTAALGAAITERDARLAAETAAAKLMYEAARRLERALWTRAYVYPVHLSMTSRLSTTALAAARKRVRKVRKYIVTHDRIARLLPRAGDLLDALSRTLPEAGPQLAVVTSLDEPVASVGRGPDTATASLPFRAQIASRRRLRKVRKFLVDRPGLATGARPLIRAIDGATRLLPEEPATWSATELGELLSAFERVAEYRRVADSHVSVVPDDPSTLSPEARAVHADLLAAFDGRAPRRRDTRD